MKERFGRIGRQLKKGAYLAALGTAITGAESFAAKWALLVVGGPISVGVGIGVGVGGHFAMKAAEKQNRKWQADACIREFYIEPYRARLLAAPSS